MRPPGIGAVLLLGAALGIVCVRAQTVNPPAASGTDQIAQIYAHTQPYMDDPLPAMQRAVPALRGLKADASQAELQSILERTSEAMEVQVPHIPDLMARESVWQAQIGVASKAQQLSFTRSGPRRRAEEYMLPEDEKQLEDRLHMRLLMGAPWKNFEYLMLFRRSPTGGAVLRESRTDVNAVNSRGPGDQQELPHGVGFGYLWLLLLPENIPQSNYRLLGRQKMYGHNAYVVAFAQSADRVSVPGEIRFLGKSYPLLYQGVAWIDDVTFQIVRLRSDMLAPLPGIQLQWLSSDLRFAKIQIPELNLPLWLPQQVELTWRQADELGGERHQYSKYRLFHATARILPPG